MGMRTRALLLGLLLHSLPGVALVAKPKVHYPPQKISSIGVERVQINGVSGLLRLKGTRADGYRVRVSHSPRADDWNLTIERRGPVLVLEVSNASLGKEWNKLVRQERWPEFDIELEGPARPTLVSWREGSLNFKTWNADVQSSFLKGDMRVEGGQGHYDLQAVNARVSVRHFRGPLEIKGEHGQAELFDLDGSVLLNWLHGFLSLTDVRSNTGIETDDARVKVRGGAGEWDVKARAGAVSLNEFTGHVKGRGQSTFWRVKGRRLGDIEVISVGGPVEVNAQSGTKVFLTSDRGLISSPFPQQDRDGHRVAESPSSRQASGQVFVRTESGGITFKY